MYTVSSSKITISTDLGLLEYHRYGGAGVSFPKEVKLAFGR